MKFSNKILTRCLPILLLLVSLPSAAEDGEFEWNSVLRPRYFGEKEIVESERIIELTAPYRAEDPALVPITVTSKIPQKPDLFIEKITLFIDKNPVPFVGEFRFTPASGKADLAMRVRVNAYSNVRAIASLSNGELHMHKVFVKASGGCSAPIAADLEAAMQRIGKMKFRVDRNAADDQPLLTQLMISHPNITGMQMDQVTRMVKPAHFVESMNVTFNDEPVLSARTDIAIGADPNFRFYFVPHGEGILKAEITDNKGMSWISSYELSP
ncbi:MAG: quinoprotein dehydrogenase-associated SoxYZ-like carrier [Gammaproteobacteria bacterium]